MTMWTYQKPKKWVRVAGVWVDPSAVVAVRDASDGVLVFLSSGAELAILTSRNTGSPAFGLTANRFMELLGEAA